MTFPSVSVDDLIAASIEVLQYFWMSISQFVISSGFKRTSETNEKNYKLTGLANIS